jgi:hypothetical protein
MNVAECACGKVRYGTKRLAKAAIKRFQPRDGRLNAYRCAGGFWHIGHLPKDVSRGRIARSDIFDPAPREYGRRRSS